MERILIADDEARIRGLLRLVLRDAGYAVLEAADGDAALASVRAHRPGVVILDVTMPGRSGLDVCREIRADGRLGDVGVIILSANATPQDAMEAGADLFLAKPFLPSRMLHAINSLRSRGSGTALDDEPGCEV